MPEKPAYETLANRVAELERELSSHREVEKSLRDSEEIVRALLNTPADAVALIDTGGTILGANELMARFFRRAVTELAGARIWDLLPTAIARQKMAYVEKVIATGEPLRFENEREGAWSDSVIFPVFDGQRRVKKIVLLIHDITARKQAEHERERLIGELREALAKVKLLKGLLPICASCKKIRDDKGYWNRIETYIQEHSEAEFSHGICPDCARLLHPELFDDNA